jgi:hypothetical protein
VCLNFGRSSLAIGCISFLGRNYSPLLQPNSLAGVKKDFPKSWPPTNNGKMTFRTLVKQKHRKLCRVTETDTLTTDCDGSAKANIRGMTVIGQRVYSYARIVAKRQAWLLRWSECMWCTVPAHRPLLHICAYI